MWHETFEDARVDIEEYIDRGEFVVAAGSVTVRSHGSDTEIRELYTWATRVRGGRIVEVREFRNAAEALKALGLSNQDAST